MFSLRWASKFIYTLSRFDVRLQLLRKKYLSAQIKSPTPSSAEIASVVRARSEVLETLNRWIHDGGGAQDALDDPQLLSSFMTFFRHKPDHEPPALLAADANVQAGFTLINENRKAVQASFITQTMRPIVKAIPDPVVEVPSATSYGPDAPDIDNIEPEELVGNMDAMAAATFRNVTQEVRRILTIPVMVLTDYVGSVCHCRHPGSTIR